MRPSPTVARPSSGRFAKRGAKPGGRDRVVGVEDDRPGTRGALRAHDESRWPFARSARRRRRGRGFRRPSSRPRAARSSAPERWRGRAHWLCTGRGETRKIWRAQGSSPSASSKPELRLPMMRTRLPWYSRAAPAFPRSAGRARRPGWWTSTDRSRPARTRRPWRGTRRRRSWSVKPSSSWRVDFHVQPYRTETPACLQKAARPRSISARDGTMKVRSISARDQRLAMRVVGRRGCCGRTTRTRACSAPPGASGFVQESRRWQIGHLRNIPPGDSSWEMTACSTPRLREAVAGLQPARPAANDHDRIVPGWEGPVFAYDRQASTSCSRRASVFSIRSMTRG